MKSESGVTLWTFCLLRLLEELEAMGCFASVFSPEYWWVCYKSSQQRQESWDCDAAVAERCSVPIICSLEVVISRFVCLCVFEFENFFIRIWKNISSIPTSTFEWWQMVLIVIIIMHNFLLSAFLLTLAVKWTSNCSCLCLPSYTQLGKPFILVTIENKILVN